MGIGGIKFPGGDTTRLKRDQKKTTPALKKLAQLAKLTIS
jgi:hypothetical protein